MPPRQDGTTPACPPCRPRLGAVPESTPNGEVDYVAEVPRRNAWSMVRKISASRAGDLAAVIGQSANPIRLDREIGRRRTVISAVLPEPFPPRKSYLSSPWIWSLPRPKTESCQTTLDGGSISHSVNRSTLRLGYTVLTIGCGSRWRTSSYRSRSAGRGKRPKGE
jgi:hypothetical protein